MIRGLKTTGLASMVLALVLVLPSLPVADETADGRRFKFLFQGNLEMSSTALRRAAKAELDAFIQNRGREADLEDATFQMEIAYRAKGYAFTTVEYTRTIRQDAVQVSFNISEGPRVMIQRIAFTGPITMPVDELRPLFGLKVTAAEEKDVRPYVRSEIDSGRGRLRSFYLARGYLDVVIDAPRLNFSEDRTQVAIEIPITEGRQFLLTDVIFRGDMPAAVSDRLQALRHDMVGQAYNRSQRLVVKSRLQEIYGDLGYAEMVVDLDEKQLPVPDGIVLEVTIHSGEVITIDAVRVQGNTKTSADFIRRRLKIETGDRFSLTQERAGFRALYRTGLFSKVDLTLEDQGQSGQRDLVVSVVEGPSREFFIEPGWGSYELLRLKLGWREKNPFGNGRSVGLESTVSVKSRQVALNLIDPWFLNTEITADLPLFYNYREEPSFTREDIGLAASFSRTFADHFSSRAAYNFRQTDISDTTEIFQEVAGEDNYNFASVKLQGTFDDRDDPFYPARGKQLTFSIEHADDILGGDITFTRITGGMRYFLSLNQGTVLALRYTTGFIFPGGGAANVPIGERFFNGGENSVRSFRQSELGPQNIAGDPVGGLAFNTINVELRRQLFGDVTGSLFFDLGNVAPNQSAFEQGRPPPSSSADAISDTFEDFFNDFRPGIGIGLHYKLPIGPARFDLAFNPDVDDERDEDRFVFHFSVGMAF